jgi:hypothetical protein
MIDPNNITRYDLSDYELEEIILFWVLAAGKKATTASLSLDKFLDNKSIKPFELIKLKGLIDLPFLMKSCGIGCFNNKSITFWQLANSNLDLRSCTAEDLEKIKGIGMKTSRCFIIHSRQNARYAGLDTHVLKYLSSLGYNVPKSTPNGKKYLEIEEIFLQLAEKSGKTIAEFDLEIWRSYSNKII